MNKKFSKGYTLIELLSVAFILVIIVGVISGILYSTLRGTSKTKISTEISENGNYVISTISNAIIDSADVTKIGASDDPPDCSSSTPPSGSIIHLKRADGNTTIFNCSGEVFTKDGVSIIDASLVKVVACSFTCQQKAGDPYSTPIVKVNFELSDLNWGLFETRSSTIFETSVSLRNYSP